MSKFYVSNIKQLLIRKKAKRSKTKKLQEKNKKIQIFPRFKDNELSFDETHRKKNIIFWLNNIL